MTSETTKVKLISKCSGVVKESYFFRVTTCLKFKYLIVQRSCCKLSLSVEMFLAQQRYRSKLGSILKVLGMVVNPESVAKENLILGFRLRHWHQWSERSKNKLYLISTYIYVTYRLLRIPESPLRGTCFGQKGLYPDFFSALRDRFYPDFRTDLLRVPFLSGLSNIALKKS